VFLSASFLRFLALLTTFCWCSHLVVAPFCNF
jgi:hypothetical protein